MPCRLPHLLTALLLAACSSPGVTDPPLTGGVGGEAQSRDEVLLPDDPGPADVRFTLDATRTHPISRFVYGVNHLHGWTGVELPAGLTLGRTGGNRWSAYNWENNASNAGSDWQYQNDDHACWSAGCDGRIAGEAVRHRVAATRARGAAAIVTVPMMGYVAADKAGPMATDEAGRATRLTTRFRESRPRKGAPFSMQPDAGDRFVYQDEFAWWLTRSFPGATGDAKAPIFFSLDNEPDIWHETHEEVWSKEGGRDRLLTYTDLAERTVAYAAAIKNVAPDARIFGPGVATWSGLTDLGRWPTPDPVAGKADFVDWYLDRMREAEAAQGRRLLDVLDLHWYTEVKADGRRLTDDRAPQTPATIEARVQAPRSLWDPTYAERSWVRDAVGGPIRLLPRLRDKIAAHYPGTRIAITEYYYGRGGDISGGIAQADALGIFGREGVFAATLWPSAAVDAQPYGGDPAKAYAYVMGAFRSFLDYDGRGGSFGSTGIAASTGDVERTSVYASTDPAHPDRVTVVAINKTGRPLSVGLTLAHTRRFTRAEVYTLADGSPTPRRQADLALSRQNALVHTLPPMSVTTLVLLR